MGKETNRMKLAYWADIIRESKTSGMKISEWCVLNQISTRKYYYWHKKVMQSTYTLAVENGCLPDGNHDDMNVDLPTVPDFAELAVPSTGCSSESKSGAGINIKRNGFTIEVSTNFSEGGLLRVLKVMQNV